MSSRVFLVKAMHVRLHIHCQCRDVSLQMMILALFNSHPRRIRHPFQALVLFFEEYAEFNWGSYSVTLNGPKHMFLATSHARPHAVGTCTAAGPGASWLLCC